MQVVAVFEGQPRVSVAWSKEGLQVRHSPVPAEKIFRHLSTAAGVMISYTVEGVATAPTPQDRLDFSNLNYGANGYTGTGAAPFSGLGTGGIRGLPR